MIRRHPLILGQKGRNSLEERGDSMVARRTLVLPILGEPGGQPGWLQESLYQRLSSVGLNGHLGRMSHVHVIVFESFISAEKFLP